MIPPVQKTAGTGKRCENLTYTKQPWQDSLGRELSTLFPDLFHLCYRGQLWYGNHKNTQPVNWSRSSTRLKNELFSVTVVHIFFIFLVSLGRRY